MERTPEQWFTEAARFYVEGHQACAWCHCAHQVHKIKAGSRTEYRCNRCDFQVSHDWNQNRFVLIPGETEGCEPAPATMHDW